jgi:hypothetical protein
MVIPGGGAVSCEIHVPPLNTKADGREQQWAPLPPLNPNLSETD